MNGPLVADRSQRAGMNILIDSTEHEDVTHSRGFTAELDELEALAIGRTADAIDAESHIAASSLHHSL